LPKLDIDRWLAHRHRPQWFNQTRPRCPLLRLPRPRPRRPHLQPRHRRLRHCRRFERTSAAEIRTRLPANATIKLTLEIAEATYNKAGVKNAFYRLRSARGVLTIPTLEATLPGDMVLQAHAASTGDAAHPLLAGNISLAGPRLRETLDWLQIDVDSVPAGRLNQFALQATLAANGPNLQLTDATFQLDDLKGPAVRP